MCMKRRKIGRMLAGIGLSICLVATPVFAEPDTIESLEQHQKDLEQQKEASQAELDALQKKLDGLIKKANELEKDLIAKGEQIIQTKKDLAEAEEREKEQYEAMKLRIKYMYEAGAGLTAEKVLESGSVSDMLSKAEYAQKVQEYDRKELEKYEKTVQDVKDLKSSLEEDMTKLQSLQKEYKSQQDELTDTIQNSKAGLSDLENMIQQAAQKVADKKAEEAAKKAAEEAAKKAAEEAARAAQVNNNSQPAAPAPSGGGSQNTSSGQSTPEPSYNASTGNAIVDRAYSWVGRAEYVWGGCSPGAFDCSGFVSYCLTGSYSRLGTTYTFMGWQRVSDPQPGDVAVNWTHTGIYIGNGQMIHAADYGIGVIVGPVQSGMIYVRY